MLTLHPPTKVRLLSLREWTLLRKGFVETQHPQVPAGSPEGGQFAPQEGAYVAFKRPGQSRQKGFIHQVHQTPQGTHYTIVKRHSKEGHVIATVPDVAPEHLQGLLPAPPIPLPVEKERSAAARKARATQRLRAAGGNPAEARLKALEWARAWPDPGSAVAVPRPGSPVPEPARIVKLTGNNARIALVQYRDGSVAEVAVETLQQGKSSFTPLAGATRPLEELVGFEVYHAPSRRRGTLQGIEAGQAILDGTGKTPWRAPVAEVTPYVPDAILKELEQRGRKVDAGKTPVAQMLRDALVQEGTWAPYRKQEEQLWAEMRPAVDRAAAQQGMGWLRVEYGPHLDRSAAKKDRAEAWLQGEQEAPPAATNAFGDLVSMAHLGFLVGARNYEWLKREGKLPPTIADFRSATGEVPTLSPEGRRAYIMRRVHLNLREYLFRGLQDTHNLVKVPDQVKKQIYHLFQQEEVLTKQTGAPPEPAAVAAALGVSEKRVRELHQIHHDFFEPAYQRAFTELEEEEVPLWEMAAAPFEEVGHSAGETVVVGTQPEAATLAGDRQDQLTAIFSRLLKKFPEQERNLLRHRFWENRSRNETAAQMNLNDDAVAALEKQVLAKMRKDPALVALVGLGKAWGGEGFLERLAEALRGGQWVFFQKGFKET